jgi:DNA helicase-2/ATP-dependent DNA helicase PcrA
MVILSGVSFEDCGPQIAEAIADRRIQGDASFGVYIHGNGPAADLSAHLTSAGVNNVAVGFPEAYGQALSVMVECLRFTNSLCGWEQVEFQLGVLATSLSRSKDLPPLARMLCGDESRPPALDERLAEIESECSSCQDPTDAIELAAGIWTRLGFTFGNQQWERAARMFKATAAGLLNRTNESWIDDTKVALEQACAHSLVGSIEDARGSVQVMNLHQTKGREADATILVFRDSEYFGRDQEPYQESSRLLYVALTRARNHDTIVVGEDPHPLVEPLRHYATDSASP